MHRPHCLYEGGNSPHGAPRFGLAGGFPLVRLASAILTLASLIGLALAVALPLRSALVEAAGRAYLAERGASEIRFTVAAFDWRRVALADLSLGPDMPVAKTVDLHFGPDGLSRMPDEVHIAGLRATVDGAGTALRDRVDALLRRFGVDLSASGAGGPALLPRILVEDAKIGFRATPAGDGSLTLHGRVEGDAAAPDIDVAAALTLDQAVAELSLATEAGPEAPQLRLAAEAAGALAALTALGLTAEAPSGNGQATVSGRLEDLPSLLADPARWLAEAPLAVDLGLAVQDAGIGGSPRATADLQLRLTRDDGVVVAALSRPGLVELTGLSHLPLPPAEGVEAITLALLPGPEPLVAWPNRGMARASMALRGTVGTGAVKLSASAKVAVEKGAVPEGPAELALDLDVEGLELAQDGFVGRVERLTWQAGGTLDTAGGSLDGALDLALGAVVAEGQGGFSTARLSAPLSFRLGPELVSATLDDGARVQVFGVSAPDLAILDSPLSAMLGETSLAFGKDSVSVAIEAAFDPLSGVLAAEGQPARRFAAEPGRIAVDFQTANPRGGVLRVERAAMTLPSDAIAVSGVSARVPLVPPGGRAEPISLSATVRDLSPSAARRFPPVLLSAEGVMRPASLRLDGEAVALDGAVRVPIAVRGNLGTGAVQADFGPTAVTFAKGGLQPGALSAALTDLRAATGTATVSGRFARPAGGALSGQATLDLADLSVSRGDLRVKGLAGELAFRSLFPPVTRGVQALTARQVIAGVPLGRTAARFALLATDAGPLLRLDRAEAALAGGRILVEELRLRPAAPRQAVEVVVQDVSLERLLRDWQIEGVNGTGVLSGRIPVVLGEEAVMVDGGALSAAEPGVLSVDWGPTRDRLVGSGQQVDLAVRALEDFRYTALGLTVNQTEGGDLTLGVALDGGNPAVLDGYPFRFNVTFSGALGPILAAMRDGERIGTELLEGGFGAIR